ncbi:methionine gamma-lyase-like [Gastrolobium bilobum]|uniref:methionine gamma-lyase-like n=1 Tax=Gastrolobium bilobum TaxID=150636 RepID=UPI002AAFF0EB|nr:methionine gamma-lyase-like [Gastrolobium bilobum]
MLLGSTMNANVAFELSERIPHLGLRMKEHSHRAKVFATRLKNLGFKVIYPGLEDHPHHDLLKSMHNKDYGYGGLFCIDMETEERANSLMNHLQLWTRTRPMVSEAHDQHRSTWQNKNHGQFGFMAVSLGYYETLMSCSGSSTSSELSSEEKFLAGISPGLIGMSIGYIGTLEQKWSQLEKALTRLQEYGLTNKN